MDEHTANNPYCCDSACWCHTNPDYNALVEQEQEASAQQQELATFAYRFLSIDGQEAQ